MRLTLLTLVLLAGCQKPVALCGPTSGGLVEPSEACTPNLVGAMICPGGPGSGYGFTCTQNACWQFFYDGPCAVFPGGSCFGASCSAAEEGQIECRSGLRSRCASGCWTDTGVCSDGG
jgi:hypothetical protein